MIRWSFAIFLILAMSSMIWWPGHFDAEHFASLAQEEITRSLEHLPEAFHNLSEKFREGIHAFADMTLFPENKNAHLEGPEMKDGFERMGQTPYWLAFKSLAATAVVRLTLAMAWFVLLIPLVVFTIGDALIVRTLRYESFACTHPTLYKTFLVLPGVLLCLSVLAILAPMPLPMILPAVIYVGFLISLHVLVSHFHRFG